MLPTSKYTYDAVGRRAEKTTGSTKLDYIYDLAGNVLSEWCTNCGGYTGPTTEYIFMSGNFMAEYKNSTTYFPHPDHLGSNRFLTALNQSVAQNLDFPPFGELNSSDSGVTTHQFTGDERDSETGPDRTWFRQYSSSLGRWMQPDRAGLAAVDITNPQSWNRYYYASNNPMNYVDPSGLSDCHPGEACWGLGADYLLASPFATYWAATTCGTAAPKSELEEEGLAGSATNSIC